MLGWLTRHAGVLAAGIPVLALLVGLSASGAGLWATHKACMGVSFSLANYATDFVNDLSTLISNLTSLTGASGSSNNWLPYLLNLFAVDILLGACVNMAVGFAVVCTGLVGLVATLSTAAVSAYMYRKAKLYANILSGVGVQE